VPALVPLALTVTTVIGRASIDCTLRKQQHKHWALLENCKVQGTHGPDLVRASVPPAGEAPPEYGRLRVTGVGTYGGLI
jgi:hypothetical protein